MYKLSSNFTIHFKSKERMFAMTIIQYKYIFLEWMYILFDYPCKKEFCKICKISTKEIEKFLFTNDPFPVYWLDVLYKHASKPKELAFISFFIDKIYGKTQKMDHYNNMAQKKKIPVPTEKEISQILEKAFELAMSDTCYSIKKMQEVFTKMLPNGVTAHISKERIVFIDANQQEFDSFEIPDFISLN